MDMDAHIWVTLGRWREQRNTPKINRKGFLVYIDIRKWNKIRYTNHITLYKYAMHMKHATNQAHKPYRHKSILYLYNSVAESQI
jgi:hypothetical protein